MMYEYDEAIQKLLMTAGIAVQTETEYTAPVKDGRLRGDISISMGLDRRTVYIGNTGAIDYAVYVYYGTKPHEIRPKTENPRYVIDKNGHRRKVTNALKTPYGAFKKVQHPGTKPNPYLDNALERLVSSGRLERLLDGFGDRMSEEMFENITKGLRTIKIK